MNELWEKKRKEEFCGEGFDPVLFNVENAVAEVQFEKRPEDEFIDPNHCHIFRVSL